jgi:glycosyltransferase involved in cell wall biosynthesis
MRKDSQMQQGVSVVICTYNGRDKLAAAIQSVYSQQYTDDFRWELLIIDNASTDGSLEFCKELISASNFASLSRVVSEPQPGAAFARKRALFESCCQWVLFVDDDNQLETDYLRKGWDIIRQNPDIGVLGGRSLPVFHGAEPSWFNKYAISFAVGPQASNSGKLPFESGRKLYSAGSFFNKKALLQYFDKGYECIMVGPKGNDLTRGEDTEWCFMIELAGYSLWYSSDLLFYHHMPTGRLTWDYLERLKIGNASGVARFQAYAPYYANSQPGKSAFWKSYFLELMRLQVLDWKLRLLQKSDNSEVGLGKKINRAKLDSYHRDMKLAYRQYKSLQKIIPEIRKIKLEQSMY